LNIFVQKYIYGDNMRILGIDPGTATTGFGILDRQYNRFSVIDFGIIETTPDQDMPQRLQKIHQGISWLIKSYQPDELAVEELFFNRNITTAITVGQARGVVLLAAAENNLPVSEYTPLQVKQAITGYGNASKKQVQYMVTNILGLSAIPKPDDAADALAIAVCHSNWLQSRTWQNK
jgi:crossover junction endodeoxyribonuclease RuvC